MADKKEGLDLILDVVEAARVRIVQFDAIETPAQAATAWHINDLLKQALLETKRLQRLAAEPKMPTVWHQQLSNAKGSRRIIVPDYRREAYDNQIEIRESIEETSDEVSTIFMRTFVPTPNGPACDVRSIKLDAKGLFDFAKAILEWYGYEPMRSSHHPDSGIEGEAIAEWLRCEAKVFRDKAEDFYESRNDGDGSELRAASLEAKADDFEELATRICAGAWKPK